MKCKSRKCRRKIDWRDWVLVALILMLAVVLYGIWYSRCFRALEYRECEERLWFYEPKEEMGVQDVILAVNEITGTSYEIIWEYDVWYAGKTKLFGTRIWIDQTISTNNLVWTYTHEIMHKELYSANERFVEFETFKTLYESGIKYFQDVALWRASIMWKGDKEYDCTWYVVQYLKE